MPQRQIAKWAGYLTGGLLGLVLIAAAAGATYQAAMSARDKRAYPMRGRLVEIGHYRLHIYCIGAGNPTVILEAGMYGDVAVWLSVQPEIARTTRVCAYDRVGNGWSDPDSAPRTTEKSTSDLHTLLTNAGIASPYVLVGHSLGGFLAPRYALQYPSEVTGMVLLDPGGPGQNRVLPAADMKVIAADMSHNRLARLIGPFGLPRIMGWCSWDSAPPQFRAELSVDGCDSKGFDATVAEDDQRRAHADGLSEWPAEGSLGAIPLTVISRDPAIVQIPVTPAAAQSEKAWGDFNEHIARFSSNGHRIIAKGANHYVQLDRPDIVIDEVRKVVDQTRQRDRGIN